MIEIHIGKRKETVKVFKIFRNLKKLINIQKILQHIEILKLSERKSSNFMKKNLQTPKHHSQLVFPSPTPLAHRGDIAIIIRST